MFLKDQKNKKIINEYSELITKTRKEYAKVVTENEQLKNKLQKYQQYVNSVPQKQQKYNYIPRKQKWRRQNYYDECETEDSDYFVPKLKNLEKLKKWHMKITSMGFNMN